VHRTYPGCNSGRRASEQTVSRGASLLRRLFARPWHPLHHRRFRDRAFRRVSVPLPQLSSSHGAGDGERYLC
jgi:hypothetical protein